MKTSREIQPGDIWNNEKMGDLKDFIFAHSQKQSREQLRRNKLLSIQYQIEDYLENNDPDKKMLVLDFVKMYIKTLNITQRKLAELFEMKDSNLHKYLVGERKLNADFVLKLSSFSHLDPECWLRVEVKNELIEIRKQNNVGAYQKYDYQNLLVAEDC